MTTSTLSNSILNKILAAGGVVHMHIDESTDKKAALFAEQVRALAELTKTMIAVMALPASAAGKTPGDLQAAYIKLVVQMGLREEKEGEEEKEKGA